MFLEINPVYLQSLFPCYLCRNPSVWNNWYNDFIIIMDRAFTVGKEIILTEDLNFDLNKSNQIWDSIIISYILKQLSNCLIRVTETNLIDQINDSCQANIIQ